MKLTTMLKKGNNPAKGNEPQTLHVNYFSLESVVQLIEAFPEEIEAVLTGLSFEKGKALEGNFPLSQSVIESNEKNIPGYSAANHFARMSCSGNQYVRHSKAGSLTLVETVNAYFGKHIAGDGTFTSMQIGFIKRKKYAVSGCKIPVYTTKISGWSGIGFCNLDKSPKETQNLPAPENMRSVSPAEYARYHITGLAKQIGLVPQTAPQLKVEPGVTYVLRK